MPVVKLNRIERRRLTVFFSSLLVAIFAWLFFTLSNRYEYPLNVRVNYVDAPFHKAFHSLNDDSVTLHIEGTGWQLLFARLKSDSAAVNVSLKALNQSSFILLTDQATSMNKQLGEGQKFLSASPDTLFFDFSKRITKKVPIKFLYKIAFKKGFGISAPLEFSPDSVILSGAAEDLKKINFWETEVFSAGKVEADLTAKVIMKPSGANMEVIPQQAKVKVPVDMFTEKQLEVPLKLLNNRGGEVLLLPEKVKITFLTSLKSYPTLERDSFLATVNLDGWQRYQFWQLPVKFKKFPAYSKLVKVEPQAVDFIIQK